MRKGILLVNLGTPDSPAVADVRKYLAEFLMDERVIDIHPFLRFLLVRGIIVPFRAPASAKLYQKIWDPKTGSPLMHNSRLQQQLLQIALGAEYVVELGMRYQTPSIGTALNKLQAAGVDSICVIPLFPQYASATAGSVMAEVMRILHKWPVIPPLSLAGAFYNHPLFIAAAVVNICRYNLSGFDHILFSFHGLPVRQLRACSPNGHNCRQEGCNDPITPQNRHCYAAQCHETARLIAREINLDPADYTVCFQSRLGRSEWIKPYTSEVIGNLAISGMKKVLVVCPAFVADCLETVYEIADEYQEQFIAAGGERLQLVESLNGSACFTEALKQLIQKERLRTAMVV